MHVEHTLPLQNQERLADVLFVSVENAIFRHRLKSYVMEQTHSVRLSNLVLRESTSGMFLLWFSVDRPVDNPALLPIIGLRERLSPARQREVLESYLAKGKQLSIAFGLQICSSPWRIGDERLWVGGFNTRKKSVCL